MKERERAEELHRTGICVDAHLDLAAEVHYRRRAGEQQVICNRYLDNWKSAGFRLIISSIFVDGDYPSTCLREALEQIQALKEDISQCDGQVCLVTSAKDLETVLAEGTTGILLSFEGVEAVENNSRLMDIFYELGVRGAGLAWNRRNFAADGYASETVEKGTCGGLTGFGVELVRRMDRLGMYFDVSHLNKEGFWDLMKFTEGPVIASHSDCQAINPIGRNLTDDQIRAVAERDGVIGVNVIDEILGVKNKEERCEKVCDHIEHVVKIAGIDHAGFGFDLCDSCMNFLRRAGEAEYHSDAIGSHAEAVKITEQLLKRGYSDEDVRKIMGENFLRVIRKVLR